MKSHKPESACEEIRRPPPTILALSRLITVWGRRRATAFFPIPPAKPARKIDKTRRL